MRRMVSGRETEKRMLNGRRDTRYRMNVTMRL